MDFPRPYETEAVNEFLDELTVAIAALQTDTDELLRMDYRAIEQMASTLSARRPLMFEQASSATPSRAELQAADRASWATSPDCPFCERIGRGMVERQTGLAVAFSDAYPVTEGHTLVVPRRHEPDFFALDDAERSDAWLLVSEVQQALVQATGEGACNVGINNGQVAGQTIGHAHVHVIPRRPGDVTDPRGGVRWVIPQKAAYWND